MWTTLRFIAFRTSYSNFHVARERAYPTNAMIEISEAIAHVLQHARPIDTEDVDLDRAVDRVLRVPICSDVDSPPHDKALMDGFAVRAADLQASQVTLRMIEEITAGEVPELPVEPGTCARIMTGAPIPTGADAVVMVERSMIDTSNPDQPLVQLTEDETVPGGKTSCVVRRA